MSPATHTIELRALFARKCSLDALSEQEVGFVFQALHNGWASARFCAKALQASLEDLMTFFIARGYPSWYGN